MILRVRRTGALGGLDYELDDHKHINKAGLQRLEKGLFLLSIMANNESPPPPHQRRNHPVYPPQVYGYQFNQQWFAQQQALMHQQIMHHQHG